jgi:prepilin-type N-terminal cleavage/methylation domain-containing protein
VRKALTLIELLIVLAVMSLFVGIVVPNFFKGSREESEELFKNRYSSLMEGLPVDGNWGEICIDFNLAELRVGGREIKLPYPPKTLVFPSELVNSELRSRYCFSPSRLGYFVLNMEKGKGEYLSVLTLLPSGESRFYSLTEAEEETLKDKAFKGRITEWFSYYSY